MNQLTIGRSSNGKLFDACVGQLITITLNENPTTGYRWKPDELQEETIFLEDSKYSTHQKSGIGGGGIRTFTFRTRSPGTSKIHLSLKREWETEKRPIDEFEVFFQVIG